MAVQGYVTVTEVEESAPTFLAAIAPSDRKFTSATIVTRQHVERQIVHASAQLDVALKGAGVSVPLTDPNAKQWAEAIVLDYVVGWLYQDYSRAGEQGDLTGEDIQKRFHDTIKHIQKDPEYWRNALMGVADNGVRTLQRNALNGTSRDPVYKMGTDRHF